MYDATANKTEPDQADGHAHGPPAKRFKLQPDQEPDPLALAAGTKDCSD